MSQKITPFLWFDKEALDAARFYTSVFENSKISNEENYTDTPSGDVQIVTLNLNGHDITLMNAGPEFKPNPSISFMLNFDPSKNEDAEKRLEELWNKLSEGGKILMPLDTYPFSKKYGWCDDKFGVSWQLILSDPDGDDRPFMIPSLLFVGEVCGRAEEAGEFYRSVFKNSKEGIIAKYPAGAEPDREGTVMFSDFQLEGIWLAAMDSAQDHKFSFNEGVSFVIDCDGQEEVNYYWNALIAGGGEESQCGWLKDKFGVSWQVVPKQLNDLMAKDKTGKVMQEMLKMQKIIVKDLEKAYSE